MRLPALGTRMVVFSGGEPLLRPEVFDAARCSRRNDMTLHLLTSGVLLERSAERRRSRVFACDRVARCVHRSAVSGRPRRRGAHGHRARRRAAPAPRAARCRSRRAPRCTARISASCRGSSTTRRAMALDGISFLPADVFSSASGGSFRRRIETAGARCATRPPSSRSSSRRRSPAIATTSHRDSSPNRRTSCGGFRSTTRRSRARAVSAVSCNAPWMSAVIEADGSVRPCFFHQSVGISPAEPLSSIVKRNLPAFRESLIDRQQSGVHALRVLDENRMEERAMAMIEQRAARHAARLRRRRGRATIARTPRTRSCARCASACWRRSAAVSPAAAASSIWAAAPAPTMNALAKAATV